MLYRHHWRAEYKLTELSMSIPKSSERPTYTLPLTKTELVEFNVRLAEYSQRRFTLGRRFRLTSDYGGIPRGTYVTVVKLWPDTKVQWDPWSKNKSVEKFSINTMSRALDNCLEYVDG